MHEHDTRLTSGEEKKADNVEEKHPQAKSEIISRYQRALDGIEQNTGIYKIRATLLTARKNKLATLAEEKDQEQFLQLLEQEIQLLENFKELHAVLQNAGNKDALIKKEGDAVYGYCSEKMYQLLTKSSYRIEDIIFLNKCIEDATGAIRYQGTFTAKRYIENLMKDANHASRKSRWRAKFAGCLAALAGAVIIGLSLAGISVPLGIGIGLIALGAGISFFKGRGTPNPLHRLAEKTKDTLPVVPAKQISYFGFAAKSGDVLSPTQKELMREVINAIKSGQFSQSLAENIYNATYTDTPPEHKTLRHFIEQHIVPYLSDQELFLFTRAVMEYHATHADKTPEILRISGTLTTDLYRQFAERMKRKNYNMVSQSDSMLILNQIVYDYMKKCRPDDSLDSAVTEILFKLPYLYLSTDRDTLKGTLTGKAPSSSNLPEEKTSKDDRMKKLDHAVSEKVFLPVEERKIALSFETIYLEKLDAIHKETADMKGELKDALDQFTTVAYTNISLVDDNIQDHRFFHDFVRRDINNIHSSLTRPSIDSRLVSLTELSKNNYDVELKEHPTYNQIVALCMAQITLKALKTISELSSIQEAGESLIKKFQTNPMDLAKIASLLIIAARVTLHPDQAETLRLEVDAIQTEHSDLQELLSKVKSLIPAASSAHRPSMPP